MTFHNPDDVFDPSLEIQSNVDAVSVMWKTLEQWDYFLECSENLNDWEQVAVFSDGAFGVAKWSANKTTEHKFYRVVSKLSRQKR